MIEEKTKEFAMSSRIQTAFPKGEPMPANIFPDFQWLRENRLELFKKHGSCVVVIYKQEIIGMGKSYDEAVADAEAHLDDDVELITPIVEYISNPHRIGLLNIKPKQD
jgi:hypothetical protein